LDEGRVPSGVYIESMGISASRVANLISLTTTFELVLSVVLTLTELGLVVHGYNSFLDDLGTLWLLHYLVSSNKSRTFYKRRLLLTAFTG
jgi:hypothetical protein